MWDPIKSVTPKVDNILPTQVHVDALPIRDRPSGNRWNHRSKRNSPKYYYYEQMKKNLHFKNALEGSTPKNSSFKVGLDGFEVTGKSPKKAELTVHDSQAKLGPKTEQKMSNMQSVSTDIAIKTDIECQPLLKTPDTIVTIENLKQSTIDAEQQKETHCKVPKNAVEEKQA